MQTDLLVDTRATKDRASARPDSDEGSYAVKVLAYLAAALFGVIFWGSIISMLL
jgi:hypothetical protein